MDKYSRQFYYLMFSAMLVQLFYFYGYTVIVLHTNLASSNISLCNALILVHTSQSHLVWINTLTME